MNRFFLKLDEPKVKGELEIIHWGSAVAVRSVTRDQKTVPVTINNVPYSVWMDLRHSSLPEDPDHPKRSMVVCNLPDGTWWGLGYDSLSRLDRIGYRESQPSSAAVKVARQWLFHRIVTELGKHPKEAAIGRYKTLRAERNLLRKEEDEYEEKLRAVRARSAKVGNDLVNAVDNVRTFPPPYPW